MIFGLFLIVIFLIGVLLTIISIKDEQNNNLDGRGNSIVPSTDGFFAI